MGTIPNTAPMTEERWYELDKHYSPAVSVGYASAAIVECLEEIARLENEAAIADAHAKEVEQHLVDMMAKLSTIRGMATRSVPQLINLAAINRILNEPTKRNMIDIAGTEKEVPRG